MHNITRELKFHNYVNFIEHCILGVSKLTPYWMFRLQLKSCFFTSSRFDFFTRLAAVFADEAARFIFGIIQLCAAILGLRIIGVAISYFKI